MIEKWYRWNSLVKSSDVWIIYPPGNVFLYT